MILNPCAATNEIIVMLVKVCGVRILNKKENHMMRDILIVKILANIEWFENACNRKGGKQ